MDRRLPPLLSFVLFLWAPSASPTLSDLELPPNQVQVAYNNEMYTGRFNFTVPVPPAVAWEVLTDFDHMASFVPNLDASQVVSRDSHGLLVAQRGKFDFGPFSVRFQSERRIEIRQRESALISRSVSGTAKHMLSEMHLSPEANGTRLEYRLEMIPDRWLPSDLGVGFLRHQVAEQFTAIAREMVRRQQRRQSL